MLGNPKEMNTTTQPETAIVNVKKVHLFACEFVCFVVCLTANKTKEIAKWIISSQALMRVRFVGFVNKVNPYKNSGCFLAKLEQQGLPMNVLSAIKSGRMNGILNARKGLSRQKKEIALISDLKNGGMITLKKGKLYPFATTINRGTETGSLSTPITVASVNVVEKKNGVSLPSIMSTMTGISKEKKGFTRMVHNFTVGLCKINSQRITESFVLTAILEEHETAVSALMRTVQRLSLRRVQSSDWKRPLPLGVMI